MGRQTETSVSGWGPPDPYSVWDATQAGVKKLFGVYDLGNKEQMLLKAVFSTMKRAEFYRESHPSSNLIVHRGNTDTFPDAILIDLGCDLAERGYMSYEVDVKSDGECIGLEATWPTIHSRNSQFHNWIKNHRAEHRKLFLWGRDDDEVLKAANTIRVALVLTELWDKPNPVTIEAYPEINTITYNKNIVEEAINTITWPKRNPLPSYSKTAPVQTWSSNGTSPDSHTLSSPSLGWVYTSTTSSPSSQLTGSLVQ